MQDSQAGAEVAVVTIDGSRVDSSDRSAKVMETPHSKTHTRKPYVCFTYFFRTICWIGTWI